MVKPQNKRVMVTLSKTTEKMLDEIADTYGMTKSAALQMMIVVFHKERMNK